MEETYKSLRDKIESFMSRGKLTIVNDGGRRYALPPRPYDPSRPQVKRQVMKPVSPENDRNSTKL